jgi:lysozyme
MKAFFILTNALFIGAEVFLLLAVHDKRERLDKLPPQAPVEAPAPAPMREVPAPRAVPFQSDASALLVKLIKEREGFHPRPYRCPAGVLTIGYGFTAQKHLALGSITEAQASEILETEIIPSAKKIVHNLVKVPLTPYQEAALVSFVYNCGEGNLARLVNGENRLNGGNYERTASLLMLYVKANGKTLRGLVERRKREAKMFLGEI